MLIAALVAISAVQAGYNIYSTDRTTKASDAYNSYLSQFYGGKASETQRFFEDYIRKHHLQGREIRYPYRSGLVADYSKVLGAASSSAANRYGRYGSYVNGAASVAKSGIYGYGMMGYAANKNFTDIMYG